MMGGRRKSRKVKTQHCVLIDTAPKNCSLIQIKLTEPNDVIENLPCTFHLMKIGAWQQFITSWIRTVNIIYQNKEQSGEELCQAQAKLG